MGGNQYPIEITLGAALTPEDREVIAYIGEVLRENYT